ncbi:MAG: hypothetical protein FJZ11_03055 [Candidatus Omnitrophica bacterium]|nr:hypothetical protein [Candidatus Omnitrophota bacterium]
MKRFALVVSAIFLLSGLVFAETKDEGVDLTIYNQNFGLVKDKRLLNIEKGISQIRFQDVASQIEPTSVHFKSLSFPEACLIQEQNYEYDLVNASKLLSKYIDKKIKILTEDGSTYEGVLMSYDNDNIIISDARDKSLNMISRKENIKNISFTELPEGLITKPTLMWQISNEKPGKHLTEVSYLTQGINWLCDYVVVADQDDKNIDLSGWVTIDNKSGTTYKDAGLKLIAGDVHRAEDDLRPQVFNAMKMVREKADQQFEEKAFFEYHMYTLQRRTTVKDNQTKQITLLTTNKVPIKKLFIYDPATDYGWYYYQEAQTSKEQKVKVKLEIENSKKNNLGMPLPKGKVKVYKKDVDGALEFIGEDAIDHTPKDEKIRLVLGEAFDVVGERKKTDYKDLNKAVDETYEISLRNHKDENIEVIVVEHLWRYSNWKLLYNSHDFTKKDAQTIEFKVPVAKNGETKIIYTVHYWWK